MVEINVQPDYVHLLVVETVGVDADMIRKYIKYQEKLERNYEFNLKK